MTHTRNTAASDSFGGETPSHRHVSAASAHDRQSKPSRSEPSRIRRVGERRERTLPVDGQTGRAYRARAEPMTVRPLRDGRYVVETDGGTYVVDVERETCTCPDSAIRGAHCKHRRRVELEIDARLLPGPNERERVCAVCGGPAFVPIDTDDERPVLCDRHDRAPGDLVRDRETGSLLVVVEALGRRADATRTDEGRLVAAYETNAAYGGQEPVFAAVYVASLSDEELRRVAAVRSGDDDGDVADSTAGARRYLFPASRLRPLADTSGRSSRVPRNTNGVGEQANAVDGGTGGVDDGSELLSLVTVDVGEA